MTNENQAGITKQPVQISYRTDGQHIFIHFSEPIHALGMTLEETRAMIEQLKIAHEHVVALLTRPH